MKFIKIYLLLFSFCIPILSASQTDSIYLQKDTSISYTSISEDSGLSQSDPVPEPAVEMDSSAASSGEAVNAYPKIALVLSGGGSRGLAQVGVLKAFDEAGIKPDLIVATSMGAIIGSFYSIGIPPDSIGSILKGVNADDIFTNSALRRKLLVSQKNEPIDYLFELRFATDLTPILPNSISHGQMIFNLLSPIISAPLYHANMNFDSLKTPLRIVSTDILTGRAVVFSKGNLSEFIRASCGAPLAFSPVAVDSMLLLDGGLTANIPVKAAMRENPDYIIAVDITSPMWGREALDNPIHLFDQIVAIGIDRQKKIQRKLADIIITPDLDGFLNTDFSQLDTIISRGYSAAKEMVPDIVKSISEIKTQAKPVSSFNNANALPLPVIFQAKRNASEPNVKNLIFELNQTNFPALLKDSLQSYLTSIFNDRNMPFANAVVSEFDSGTMVTIDPGVIHEIVIEGNANTSPRLIKTTSGLKKGSLLNKDKIEDAVSALYATDLFHTVNIYVDSLCAVHIKVVEKEYWRSRLGLRFDEYHLLEGFIQPAYENLFGTALCASLHLQYGKKREKYAFELAANRPWSINWANNISLQSYIARDRIIDVTKEEIIDTIILGDTTYVTRIIYNEESLLKTGFLFMLGVQVGRVAMIDGSIRLERFRLEQTESGVFDALGPFKKGIRFAKLRLTVDDLDRFPFPRKGQKHYISIGGARDIIGGTENFITIQGRLQYYFTFLKRHTCSPLIMFSWADQSLPPVEQVYIGGSLPEEKYRDMGVYHYMPFVGLKPRAISGDIMVLLHGLYRFAVTKKIFLTALVDWGYAWNQDNTPDRPEFDFDTKTAKHFISNAPVGIGLGFAVQTPVGPLKLSWGRVIYGSLKEDFGIDKENVICFSAGYDF